MFGNQDNAMISGLLEQITYGRDKRTRNWWNVTTTIDVVYERYEGNIDGQKTCMQTNWEMMSYPMFFNNEEETVFIIFNRPTTNYIFDFFDTFHKEK